MLKRELFIYFALLLSGIVMRANTEIRTKQRIESSKGYLLLDVLRFQLVNVVAGILVSLVPVSFSSEQKRTKLKYNAIHAIFAVILLYHKNCIIFPCHQPCQSILFWFSLCPMPLGFRNQQAQFL